MGLNVFKNKRKSYINYKKKELKFKIFKILVHNYKLRLNIRTFSLILSTIFQRKLGKNICFLSGKDASVYRPWNLSRNFFRKLIEKKQIFGIKKTSW